MDPSTLVVSVLFVSVTLVLAWAAVRHAPKSSLEDALAGPARGTAMTSVWATSAVSALGVPALMILFSVLIPPLGNPLFLGVGASIGFLLPWFWRRR
jgi:hypothetical protein